MASRYAVLHESEGSPYAFCSGVLFDPNIVLTAGQCVCVTSQSPDVIRSARPGLGLSSSPWRRHEDILEVGGRAAGAGGRELW
ncbi:MAG: trypsin-like serine protease [Myxococcaceae bacterium]|nr:trypsin-like serine protease [Myxococcaceae bacterium]